MKINVFFSWQATTLRKYNKNFILDCIEKAVKTIQKQPIFNKVEFIVDEGVRYESGSPEVASTILMKKIPNCDVFIADLSVVNQQNKIVKCFLSIFGNKFKPFQNNNVIKEYGVAVSSIGYEHIIGVMNSVYGSPNDNPDNIPFDLKHVRFPIEYSYSQHTNEKEVIQKALIKNLERAIRETSIYALQRKKNKYRPLMVWEDWENEMNVDYDFFSNEKIDEIKELILSIIDKPNQTSRILGLSGLGKTRILFEIFKPIPYSEEKALIASRVLYADCNKIPQFDFYSLFTSLQKDNENRIVILDNCSVETHRIIIDFAKKGTNRLSFITIDSNPEEIESDNKIKEINYILIKKEELKSVVEQILNVNFGQLEKERIDKIREFSQGIPLMAVLLGNSVKSGEEFIGKLDDKSLLNKLLGEKGKEEKVRKVLRSCSLFSYFGYYDELERQTEFIATNKYITPIDGADEVLINDFKTICEFYIKREILEKRGRYISMRPLPLAIYLAQEWLEPCNDKRLSCVIQSIDGLDATDKRILSESLSEQMKFLGYSEKANSIVEKIIGLNSPFDNAEVLNTELGSRLFRSFVEVNPVAVLNNFVRNFSNKSKEELLKIDNGRRNLVWVLEKLCFDRRTFFEGAKILCSFAVAENEKWANNSTNQFLHLFQIYLPGTESSLEERWRLIEWALNHNKNEYNKLALDAMRSGLSYGHFSRTSGAEVQGSKKLNDYQPKPWEIRDYWGKIISKLTLLAKSEGIFSELASDIIVGCLRSICYAGASDLIIPVVKEIAEFKKHEWVKGLDKIKETYKFDKKRLSNPEKQEIENLIKLLTKDDFKTRFLTIINSYHLEDDETYSYDKVLEAVYQLADEFYSKQYNIEEYLNLFYSNNYVNAFPFGLRLYQLVKDEENWIENFINLSVKVLLNLEREKRNPTVLGGFIAESTDETKDKVYSILYKDIELNSLLFYLLSVDKVGVKRLNLLFELVENGVCPISNFLIFNNSNALRNYSVNELKEFSDKLLRHGKEAYYIVFEIFSNHRNYDKEQKYIIHQILKECVKNINLSDEFGSKVDNYKWADVVCSILDKTNDIDFAISINDLIISSISHRLMSRHEYGIQRVYFILIQQYFTHIWHNLSKAFLSDTEEFYKYWGLKNLLGSHIGGVGNQIGILFNGDIDIIFKWCNQNKPEAPSRLASLVPVFGGQNNKYEEWHPIALRLLDEFGDIEDVLSNLGANMGTYSWVGSAVPLLEAKKNLFSKVSNHKFEMVSSWAKRNIFSLEQEIKFEKNQDEERFI